MDYLSSLYQSLPHHHLSWRRRAEKTLYSSLASAVFRDIGAVILDLKSSLLFSLLTAAGQTWHRVHCNLRAM